MSTLPKSYDHLKVEPKWQSFWETREFFKANVESEKPPFCIILPPPNVTGVLHMGHALDDTLQDILIRYKRMQGYEVLWLPGFDHAGISTQTVVEKHLIKTEGKRRKDYTREAFLQHIWVWKEKHEEEIIKQLKMVGCSLDWSRKRFTMDEKSSAAVRKAFKKLYDEGLIYRGDYLVNWDPITQTALADDEVEYEEAKSHLYHFRYPIIGTNDFIEIATTRPETMLGDTAVAVSPKDERYQHLIGQKVYLPLCDREIPIIGDTYVDPEFGTGCVKITPAHDFNDYEIGLKHRLPMINIMTPDGKINENGGHFEGLTMQEAREAVIEKMKELKAFVKATPHINRIGYSYRSKAVIEPYLSKQWFVKMSAFRDELLDLVHSGKVELLPQHYHKTYEAWITNLRDWCISRQLWWGHRIPIWYHKNNPDQMLCYDGDDLPDEIKKDPSQWEQDEDVLDTWFSSALWPFSTLGWPDSSEDFNKFFPTSILITGHDILFFWVARMMLMSHIALKQIPFHKTFIHGLIYGKSYWHTDKEGQTHYLTSKERLKYEMGEPLPKDISSKWEKMSKSKGNVIDPLEIIHLYGADAMRMALCSSVTDSRQIDLDRRRFEEYKNFSNKLWNAARFILMNLEPLTSEEFAKGLDFNSTTLDDLWILSRLNRLIQQVSACLDSYDFDDAALSVYSFFWDEFCAYYLETTKPYFFNEKQHPIQSMNKRKILLVILVASVRLIHPFAPFITEEIFSHLNQRFKNLHLKNHADPYTENTTRALQSEACAIAPFPTVFRSKDIDEIVESNFQSVNELIYKVRNIRGEMQIPPSEPVDVFYSGDPNSQFIEIIKENEIIIKALVKIKTLQFCLDLPKIEYAATGMLNHVKLLIPLPKILIEAEQKRLEKELEKLQKLAVDLENKLSNAQFIERAPAELVDKTRENLTTTKIKIDEIQSKL
ncbi:MAG: valine--tRNA ligase [Simkaniaceae bacterium]|nr:valine--tRNA ligase [Simkaniaceae bacterium]